MSDIIKIGEYEVDKEKLFNEDTCDGEIFRKYNDRFLVSNMARCYDMKRKYFIRDYQSGDYMVWYLGDYTDDETERRNMRRAIHRVVAECFCEKPTTAQRLVVDHIDGNKKNNLASNLRFITYCENSNAQDVQERKSKSIKKTTQHRKEKDALTAALVESNERINELECENIDLENKVTELNRKIKYLEEELLKSRTSYEEDEKEELMKKIDKLSSDNMKLNKIIKNYEGYFKEQGYEITYKVKI